MKYCSRWFLLFIGLIFFVGLQTNALAAVSTNGPLKLIVSSIAVELTPTTTTTTAPIATTTTTVAETSTTTTSPSVTTTTSSSGGCPAKTVLGERQQDLNMLRALRNEILLKTQAGQLYTVLYYKHAFEVSNIFAHNEELKEKATMLIQSIMPAVESLIAKKEVVIGADTVQKSIELIDALTAQASPALEEDLNNLKQDINNGVIFKTFGVTDQKE